MRTKSLLPGRLAAAWAAVIAVSGAVSATGVGAASASPEAAISGQVTATPVSPTAVPIQLLAGTDGGLWFVNAGSQLGQISATGEAGLTGVDLPQGQLIEQGYERTIPAVLAAAGTEGVWAYTDDADYLTGVYGCTITLVDPAGSMSHPQLPSATRNHQCMGAAADGSGDLWVSLYGGCSSCRIGGVAEVTPAGQVTLYSPVRPGGKPGPAALGSDGAIWVLEGNRQQVYGRYTAGGTPVDAGNTPAVGHHGEQWRTLLAAPAGSFWLLYPASYSVDLSTPGGANTAYTFPVSPAAAAVGSDGSLWMVGGERDGVSRFFRMGLTGTVDRSPALTTGAGGAALQAEGPLAITADGTAWAVAAAGSTAYVVRFVPS